MIDDVGIAVVGFGAFCVLYWLLVIEPRSGAHLYRALNLVERFFNKIKQCRRVATRYDKLAANYLAFIQLASIRLWLRAYESIP